ncbi:uncharacterized protein LOC125043097 [Penaeus chinensis]|uniref:uncharacterized protein LOC125043097 n=1 Tax=Penaeus chinensis TaxID=139456 RepID=UPI001FB75052|nr:uncharacterized protein LOC125043097 [Penaeus chinensis]
MLQNLHTASSRSLRLLRGSRSTHSMRSARTADSETARAAPYVFLVTSDFAKSEEERVLLSSMVAPHNNGRLTRSLVRIPGSGSCRAAGAVYQDFSRVSGVAAMVAAQHPPPQAMMQAQHRNLSSSSMDAAFFRKMTAIEDSLPGGAGVEIGGPEARWARRDAPDVRTGARAGGGASARSAGGGGVPPSMPTSSQPARDRNPYGTPRKRLRSHPSEGNGEAVVPPQAKAPKVMYMAVPVVGGAGAASPAPGRVAAAAMLVPTLSEGPVGVKGDDERPTVRMVAAGRPFVLSGESMKQLLDERNQLVQENQALSQRVQAFQQLFRNRTRLLSVLRTLGLTVV